MDAVIKKVQHNSNYPEDSHPDRLGPSGKTFSYCNCATTFCGLNFFPEYSNTHYELRINVLFVRKKICKKVKQSHYRPEQAQRVPGG